MFKLGIECENLEAGQSRWGVGHLVLNFIEAYLDMPEWRDKVQLHLYFKSRIPDDPVLKNPRLVKKIVGPSFIDSFNIYYHIFLPISAQADELDIMFFPAYNLPPLYLKKSAVLLTNDIHYEYTQGNLPFRYRLAYFLFSNWAAIKAWKILAISEASKKEVAKLYRINPDRIFVSHLGVDYKLYDISLYHKEDENFGKYILYIGQMFPRRHVKELIRAFKSIANDLPEYNLILVGKDKYRPMIIKELVESTNQELGRERIKYFEYMSSDDDIRTLYQNASLFVYCSSHEAFGLPPVEAAGYGVPVVVNDDELNHELFGDAGFFIKDINSAESLAGALKEGVNNQEKRQAIINKYKEIIPGLNWNKFADRFLSNIYESR